MSEELLAECEAAHEEATDLRAELKKHVGGIPTAADRLSSRPSAVQAAMAAAATAAAAANFDPMGAPVGVQTPRSPQANRAAPRQYAQPLSPTSEPPRRQPQQDLISEAQNLIWPQQVFQSPQMAERQRQAQVMQPSMQPYQSAALQSAQLQSSQIQNLSRIHQQQQQQQPQQQQQQPPPTPTPTRTPQRHPQHHRVTSRSHQTTSHQEYEQYQQHPRVSSVQEYEQYQQQPRLLSSRPYMEQPPPPSPRAAPRPTYSTPSVAAPQGRYVF
jgi:hypothetical protein